jgi:predicted DCC family thiol-disulfide oxidoreductase YuxK
VDLIRTPRRDRPVTPLLGMVPMKHDVVLYDGECKFCIGQIAHLRRLDRAGRLRFVSLHDPQVAIDYPDLSYDQLMEQIWVIDPRGGRHGGAYALRYLSRVLPLLWPLAPMLHIPGLMPVWSWIYRQIARRRYRIAGRHCEGGTCAIHASKATSSSR